ncbi:hypothetical protein LTR53_020466, partial [Teratosphaeriaceae sp. CCFEE 6253]
RRGCHHRTLPDPGPHHHLEVRGEHHLRGRHLRARGHGPLGLRRHRALHCQRRRVHGPDGEVQHHDQRHGSITRRRLRSPD